jgi:hypothetical protein
MYVSRAFRPGKVKNLGKRHGDKKNLRTFALMEAIVNVYGNNL